VFSREPPDCHPTQARHPTLAQPAQAVAISPTAVTTDHIVVVAVIIVAAAAVALPHKTRATKRAHQLVRGAVAEPQPRQALPAQRPSLWGQQP
jgi:hypothetical protein